MMPCEQNFQDVGNMPSTVITMALTGFLKSIHKRSERIYRERYDCFERMTEKSSATLLLEIGDRCVVLNGQNG